LTKTKKYATIKAEHCKQKWRVGMKRQITVLFMALAAFAAQADIVAKFTLRFPEIFGLGRPRAEIEVMNNTIFQAELFVIDEKVASLEPGEIVTDMEIVSFEEEPEPMVAFLFNMETGAYVGVAAQVLHLRSGRKTFWEIRGEDVFWHPVKPPRAEEKPGIQMLPEHREFPRIALRGTNIIQLVNNTGYDMYVRKDRTGGMGVLVRNGDLYVIEAHRLSSQSPSQLFLELNLFYGNVFVERVVRTFPVLPDGPRATQVIIRPL